ncbi:TPA: hypothetical protein N0F65_003280 [Lagenidium giganteum]|uniref:Uncharacterized protein n=1 Tax=Lagenidium giganteum TaxID=4803 RepID=A0AAV2YXE7_9STRA|nr:TPA: hypothetical protein N0F65_003280 [Lagenidium giganteum]
MHPCRCPRSVCKRRTGVHICGTGFIGWETTRGTFTRLSFHMAFLRQVILKHNPWPLLSCWTMHAFTSIQNCRMPFNPVAQSRSSCRQKSIQSKCYYLAN